MPPSLRCYQDDTDYWRIRTFLREVYLWHGRRELSWSLLRWDYWRWHGVENLTHDCLSEVVFLWETAGQIAAVLNPEGPGEAFFQVHPGRAEPGLEAAMLAMAERELAATTADGRRSLTVWVPRSDEARQALVTAAGYSKGEPAEHLQCRSLDGAVPDVPLPAGYGVRALGEVAELPARSWLSWKAFHPNEPDTAYQGWEWYLNVQRGPLYRRDLDLVAVAADGTLAAFCTVWFDDVTRTAVFEPVGTHPDYHRRGLGKAVMTESLRRAARLGATLATVSSYSAGAHALYTAVNFRDYELSEPWRKTW
jgi:mycothiol synthase